MINNTSIGKQMYKLMYSKEGTQKRFGSSALRYVPRDRFLALQQIQLVLQISEFPSFPRVSSSGKQRV